MKIEEDRVMWTAQTQLVADIVEREGASCVKKQYIDKKYGEAAWVFKIAYEYFSGKMEERIEKPKDAQSPVWLYRDPKWVGMQEGMVLLELHIPKEEILFFDLRKWSKVLNLSYIGSPEEEAEFEKKMREQGISHAMEVFQKPYYPLWKARIVKSWEALFDVAGIDEQYLQGAVWCIKSQWIKK